MPALLLPTPVPSPTRRTLLTLLVLADIVEEHAAIVDFCSFKPYSSLLLDLDLGLVNSATSERRVLLGLQLLSELRLWAAGFLVNEETGDSSSASVASSTRTRDELGTDMHDLLREGLIS